MPDWEKRFDTVPESHGMWDNIVVVTDRKLCEKPFDEQIDLLCSKHPRALILCEPDLDEQEYAKLARQTMLTCTLYGVRFVPVGHVNLAEKLGLEVVHLSTDEIKETPESTLSLFSGIGTSVRTLDQAIEAKNLGVKFMLAGPIFETEHEPGAIPKGMGFVHNVMSVTRMQTFGIGGMTADEKLVKESLRAGGSGIAIRTAAMKMEG
ncbi:MAG: thiamine phosphate synthase [Coriobacteriales bacterium]|jgi:thiamine-phosphate pyrophosphorylase